MYCPSTSLQRLPIASSSVAYVFFEYRGVSLFAIDQRYRDAPSRLKTVSVKPFQCRQRFPDLFDRFQSSADLKAVRAASTH